MFNQKFIIAFEGIDGCGKTTQCKMFRDYLNNQGFLNRFIKFPSDYFDKRLFNEIKTGCTDKEFFYKFKTVVEVYEETKYYFMDLVRNSNHEIVVCDRYKYTRNGNLQFQIEGVKKEIVYLLSNWMPDPDLLFYFDIDASIAMARIQSRGGMIHWHEDEKKLSKISRYFNEEIKYLNTKLYRLDGNESIDSLHTKICDAFTEYVSKIDNFPFRKPMSIL